MLKKRRPQFRGRVRKPRMNGQIRVAEVQVVDDNGDQLGVMSTSKALELAAEKDMDLVEMSATSSPPVTRIMDYGRQQYLKDKKKRESKASSKAGQQEVKAVRITFRAGDHDLEIRAKQADKFMTKGHRVKVDLKLRGREKGMQDMAKEKFDKFFGFLKTEIVKEGPVKKSPFGLSILIRKL